MNIILFKKQIEQIEEYESSSKRFRIWAKNSYEKYIKLREYEEEDKKREYENERDYYLSQEFSEFKDQWQNIPLERVIRLYSEMGWELDDNIKNNELKLDYDSDCLYYYTEIDNVYEKIFTIEDDICFCYATCLLMAFIPKDTKLYENLVKELSVGLDKCDLTKAKNIAEYKNKETVFVAMSFSRKMKNAKKKISDAISECGYVPMLIDLKEYNNQIVPEIFKEITNSKFVVADLTEQRGGVYYEAGYAQALDKQVIFMCREDEINNVHFDVKQFNTIFWEDEDELYKRLIKRINATIEGK